MFARAAEVHYTQRCSMGRSFLMTAAAACEADAAALHVQLLPQTRIAARRSRLQEECEGNYQQNRRSRQAPSRPCGAG